MARLDSNTLNEYLAQETTAGRAQAIVSALTGTVTFNIRNGSNTIMANGTMANPWATESGGSVIIGELASALTVSTGGTPDVTWYIEFISGTRWITGSFGVLGAGTEFEWSLSTFQTGQTATLGTVSFSSDTATEIPAKVTGVQITGQTSSAISLSWNNAIDQTPPSQVTGVNTSGITTTGLSLSWIAASDDVGVTGYELQRATDTGFTQNLVTTTLGVALTTSVSGLAAGTTYRFRIRARDAAGNWGVYSATAAATTISTGIDTTNRKLWTNFAGLTNANWQWYAGPGANFQGPSRYGYTPATWPPTQDGIEGTPDSPTGYSCGDTPWLIGTDTDTGQVFNQDSPALFGLVGAGTNMGATFRVSYLTGVNSQINRDNITYPFMAPSKCFQLDFKTGVDGPAGTGITTALRLRKKRPYRQPDQLNPQLMVNGAAGTNKLIYTRQWTRFLSAAKATSGVGWIDAHMSSPTNDRFNVLINHKMTGSSQGFRYTLNLAWNWRTNLIQFLSTCDTQSTTGTVLGTALGNWDQFHAFWHGTGLVEDQWYLIETAIRPGNTSTRGTVWCAIDGVVICNKTTQTVGTGLSEQHAEHFPFQHYGSWAIAGAEREVTGHETWESIPSNASTPHDLPLNTNLNPQ